MPKTTDTATSLRKCEYRKLMTDLSTAWMWKKIPQAALTRAVAGICLASSEERSAPASSISSAVRNAPRGHGTQYARAFSRFSPDGELTPVQVLSLIVMVGIRVPSVSVVHVVQNNTEQVGRLQALQSALKQLSFGLPRAGHNQDSVRHSGKNVAIRRRHQGRTVYYDEPVILLQASEDLAGAIRSQEPYGVHDQASAGQHIHVADPGYVIVQAAVGLGHQITETFFDR